MTESLRLPPAALAAIPALRGFPAARPPPRRSRASAHTPLKRPSGRAHGSKVRKKKPMPKQIIIRVPPTLDEQIHRAHRRTYRIHGLSLNKWLTAIIEEGIS